MQILLDRPVAERLLEELHRAGAQEIGGLLMGEHLRDEVFRLADISVQRSGGTHSDFVRSPEKHQEQLDAFFARTGNDYARFNYLGEWHSHPRFAPLPSDEDVNTMQSIVDDPAAGVNFLVLLIVRLAAEQRLEMTASAFRRGGPPVPVQLSADVQRKGGPVPDGISSSGSERPDS